MYLRNCTPLLPSNICCMLVSRYPIDLFPIKWLTRFAISNTSWKSSSNSTTADTLSDPPTQKYPPWPFKNLLMLCSSFKSLLLIRSMNVFNLWQHIYPKKYLVQRLMCVLYYLHFFKIKWSIRLIIYCFKTSNVNAHSYLYQQQPNFLPLKYEEVLAKLRLYFTFLLKGFKFLIHFLFFMKEMSSNSVTLLSLFCWQARFLSCLNVEQNKGYVVWTSRTITKEMNNQLPIQ